MAEERQDEINGESCAPKRVLTIFAHPDDAEFSCGGTIARWAAEGHHITMCVVTNGDRGSDDPAMTPGQLAETRFVEQWDAARILGVEDVIFLGWQDGMVVADLDLRRDLTRIVRRVRPDIVILGDPGIRYYGTEYINHPDHNAVAEAALGAVFPSAGNRLYFPELLIEGLEPIKIREVYMSNPAEPETWIDVSDYMETKINALRAHKCQMGDWDPNDMVRQWNAEDGKKSDPPVAYAEDFRRFLTSG